MEIQVQFLRSAFILLVASYVAYACSCWRLTLEQSLCPQNNRTVLMAHAKTNATYTDYYGNISTSPYASYAKYEMKMEEFFKNGTFPLGTDDGGFHMIFPRISSLCGRAFNTSDSYLFVGRVDSGGNFRSDICEYVKPKAEIVNNSTIMDILHGNRERNCTHI
ncbi:hypothetical protein ACJMK2_032693 [Sinanodonta woodiana]|uniref:NTR domain-containing protein n=1 Tax=Sinanodonta woodiana TaxID=1069815 RepID=A0ABD3X417_SINWO